MSADLLQVFVELGNLYGTSNEQRPLLILLTITRYKCKEFLYCYASVVRIESATSR